MVKIGDRVETINFGWCEVITDQYEVDGKKSRGGWVDVRFDDTGYVRKLVNGDFFLQGGVRDGSITVNLEVGQIWNTNQDGKIKIARIIDSVHTEVEFVLTGNLHRCQKDALLRGFVKDRPAVNARVEKQEEESRLRAKEWAAKIQLNKEVREQQRVLIQANKVEREIRAEVLKVESYERWVAYKKAELAREVNNQQLISCAIDIVERDTNEYVATKGVLDIEFKDRQGKWVMRYRNPKTGEFIQTRLGKIHNNFTQRANKNGSVQNTYGKSYSGVSCSSLFSDAQLFSDWAVTQYGWSLGYQLEKDLLVDGNREYGEDVCCFLPQCINNVIKSSSSGTVVANGDFFSVFASLNGNRIALGKYGSKEEAEETALNFKRKRLYKLAQEYRESIDPRAYERLLNY